MNDKYKYKQSEDLLGYYGNLSETTSIFQN